MFNKKINNKNLLPVIIGIILIIIIIVIIIVYFVIISKNKEKFIANTSYQLNSFNTTPSQTEQNLINKIVNDIETCFNPSFVSPLTTADLNLLTTSFINNWRDNILDGIKNKLYFGYVGETETLMSKYYKDIFNKLRLAYCSPNNKNYADFLSIYKSELSKIVSHIECLIKKVQFIKRGLKPNEISINTKELYYQVECIQQFIYAGLRNQGADPIVFYEKLYELIMKAENDDYNFCMNTAIDKDINVNKAIQNPMIGNYCKDLTDSFIIPNPTIIPNACIIGSSCTNKTPVPRVQKIDDMILNYNKPNTSTSQTSTSSSSQVRSSIVGTSTETALPTQRIPTKTTLNPTYAAILARTYDNLRGQQSPIYNNSGLLGGPIQPIEQRPSPIQPIQQQNQQQRQPIQQQNQQQRQPIQQQNQQPIESIQMDNLGEMNESIQQALMNESIKPALMDDLAGMDESINFPLSLEVLNTPSADSVMNFNPTYQNIPSTQKITMTKPYKTTHSSLPVSFKNTNNNNNNIIPKNTNDYDDFAEFQLMQPNINLLSAKGPNNFFIPNIWIEEYKNAF